MMRFKGSFCILALFLFMSGCKKEDPNPELLDPIFVDLDHRASEAQKGLEDEEKKTGDLKAAVDKAEPNTIYLKDAVRALEKSQHLILELKQRAKYYKIRSTRRQLVDRITYKEAFANNQPWPDPREYSDYQVNIRLREVPLNWSQRVPKLQDRLANAHAKPAKGKEGASKGEE